MLREEIMKLDWPPKVLNPNSIAYWRKKAAAKKKYRAECCLLTKADGKRKFPEGPINLKISFYPPDKRKRDDDNAISAFKAGRDGVAEAWGVDDNRFKPLYVFCEPVEHGAVKIEVLS